jgi:hypothetical protein
MRTIFNFLEDPPVDFLAIFGLLLTIVRSDQRRDQIRGGKKKGGGERGEIGLRWDQTEAGLDSGGGIGWRRDRMEAGSDGGGSDGGGIGRRRDQTEAQDQTEVERRKIRTRRRRNARSE